MKSQFSAPETQSSPPMVALTSRPVEKYVEQTEPLLNNQIELFLQQVAYFKNSHVCSKGVKGRLAKHVQYWQSIGASEFVIDTIKNGYVVPFQRPPPPMFFKNNKSAIDNAKFVDQSTADLLETGCIERVPYQEEG